MWVGLLICIVGCESRYKNQTFSVKLSRPIRQVPTIEYYVIRTANASREWSPFAPVNRAERENTILLVWSRLALTLQCQGGAVTISRPAGLN